MSRLALIFSKHWSKLNFGLQISLKMASIGLGVIIYRFQNIYFSELELYNLAKISAYSLTILGFINLGIPQIIQKFYTANLAEFKNKQLEFAQFWQAFLVLRILSYLFGVLLILITFKLSSIDNLLVVIGLFTAQFILVLDIGFRSVCDAAGRSWQFSLTDFLGKIILVGSLYGITTVLSKASDVGLIWSPFNWFIILSILAYFAAFLLDCWLQRDLTFSFNQNTDLKNQLEKSKLQPNQNSVINSSSSPNLDKVLEASRLIKTTTLDDSPVSQKSKPNWLQSWQSQFIIWVQIWQTYQKDILFLGSATFITGLFLRTDILFLDWVKVNQSALVGYSNSYRLFEIASVIPTLLAPVLASQFIQKLKPRPFMDQSGQSNFPDNFILAKFLGQVSLIGAVCTTLLVTLAPIGLLIIDPQKRFWSESLLVIWPLAAILIFNGLSSFLGNLTIFLGGSHFELILSLTNLVIASIFYMILIPKFGTMGAAIASLIIYVFDLLLRSWFFWRVWQKRLL